jgi:cytochrome c-type biogenesis protein
METLIVSFIAGAFTVAAPCILPLLPVIVGGTAVAGGKNQWFRPLVITGSLAVSVIAFSLLLKATTALLGVPQSVWNVISGGIVLLFGVNLLFPSAWEKLSLKSGLYAASNKLSTVPYAHTGLARDILLGASLGPIFSSCSPTYALIIAVILPQSFAAGFANLTAYALGLASVLLLIAVAGQSVTQKLGWAANPRGGFKKALGVIFIAVGTAVIFGFDKAVQAFVLEQGWYDPIQKIEMWLW